MSYDLVMLQLLKKSHKKPSEKCNKKWDLYAIYMS